MVGAIGQVTTLVDGQVWALVHGERWQVRSVDSLAIGQAVRVTGMNGLILMVQPLSAESVASGDSAV